MAEDNGQTSVQTTQTSHVEMKLTQETNSPFPLASEIKGYEEILPGAADRIFKLVELQSKHRQEMEKRELEIESRNSLWGLIFAFVFAMSVLGGTVYLALSDHTEAAAVVGAGGLATAIGSFLQIKKRNNKNDDEQTP